jgi:hypothetical protein
VNFHGERRSNTTHASTTDAEARHFRKGDTHEAKFYYQGHVLMENRHGLAVDGSLTPATGFAEREQALAMATLLPAGATLGADKGYDTRDFVDGLRGLPVTPHIAQNMTHRRSTLDRRTTRHPGYQTSQRQAHRRDLRLAHDGRPCCARPDIAASRASAECLPLGSPSTLGPAAAPHRPADMKSCDRRPRRAAVAIGPGQARGRRQPSTRMPTAMRSSPSFSVAC